ncbi:penicillin-binding protein 1A [Sporosalibacterium faouarense]|uniref:penicillin-binding protein 1A n=1 Tax=Sporosalibacterium faouarense TaxID=516123 RepID=UPI00192BDD02|nr:PBP1A family penicillin-binding protein [Sporosalibacterium faouarense]
MAKNNNNETPRRSKKSDKKNKRIGVRIFKFVLITILMVGFITAGSVAGLVIAIAKDAPDIDSSSIITNLNESSVILDENGNLIERIHTEEFRQIVSLDKIPKHVQDAFVAIEDERFETHKGVDIKRIAGALYADIKAGAPVQGASTITQQLVKNVYLLDEVDRQNLMNDVARKIKEAYLSIQIERELTKDQILEAYLNRISLGQGAYGIQAASKTYFSKDVSELSIAEAAMIAGITKNPSRYPLFWTVRPENVDENDDTVLGDIVIDGQNYVMVYNDTEELLNRKNTVLAKMRELNYITDEEYEDAKNVNIKDVLKPTKKEQKNISSYFGDYVREEVLDTLVNELGYSRERASDLLLYGGLEIYSTIDADLQSRVEGVFNNFDQVLSKYDNNSEPRLVDPDSFRNGNIVDENGRIVYYKKASLLSSDGSLIIDNGSYKVNEDGTLFINNNKLNIYSGTVDVVDYYSINANKNLVTTELGSLTLKPEDYTKDNGVKGDITIKAQFLKDHEDFYRVDENGNLLISSKYFADYFKSVLQPQSAVVIMDQYTGKIKALMGGRDVEGRRVYNRAIDAHRQPGSAIKPLGVYLPALDSGNYTAASIIDDIIHYDASGNRWPKNWYEGYRSYTYAYRGLTTLRESVEQSVNVNAVKVLEDIGIGTSMSYLNKMGLGDSLVTRDENRVANDEQLASLALGGLTRGFTPLEMTAAYSTISNQGIYTEPIAFTKIVDSEGNPIYENKPVKHRVVSPQVAYLMSDILESTVSDGLAGSAMIDEALFGTRTNKQIPVAGKTGTTQNKVDAWFVGYSPYYTTSVWIGNDSNYLTLPEGSSMATTLWSNIMAEAHRGYEPKSFEMPEGFVTKKICIESGKLATDLCYQDPRGSRVKTEIFIKGTEPTEYCDLHVEVDIDTSTGKLATEFCPPELVEKRVLIQRTLPYDPWDPELMKFIENDLKKAENRNSRGKIFLRPKDYQFNAPIEYCPDHTEEEKEDPGSIWDWIFGDDKDDEDQDNNDNNNGNDNENNSNNTEDNNNQQNQEDGVNIIDSNDESQNGNNNNSNGDSTDNN